MLEAIGLTVVTTELFNNMFAFLMSFLRSDIFHLMRT